jgi:hypothetical protein
MIRRFPVDPWAGTVNPPLATTAVSGTNAELSPIVAGGWLTVSDDEEIVMLRELSLWQRITALLAAGGCGEFIAAAQAVLPTQRRHSKADPRALSQRPISLGGRPDSLAHARFE